MSGAHLEPARAPDFWGVFNFRAQMSSKKSSKPNRPLEKKRYTWTVDPWIALPHKLGTLTYVDPFFIGTSGV